MKPKEMGMEAHHALQVGEVRLGDEENWHGDAVLQGLEEGELAAHGAAHHGLVGCRKSKWRRWI